MNEKCQFNRGFKKVPTRPNFQEIDRKWQSIWKKNRLLFVTDDLRKNAEPWVFFDGPPGTNGRPHIGHMMQSALKDVWPRFWTMRGKRVIRRAGWDTHGLPVELTAEKELNIGTKREIESYGVQNYINYCRDTVFRYKSDWENAIRRIGREIHLEDAYATYQRPYIETGWWFLKRAWNTQLNQNGELYYGENEQNGFRRLLYRADRIMPYCCRCGTPLSNFEVSQGYKTTTDITLFVKFPLVNQQDTFFVAWTTTAWTLLSNMALAVGPEIEYVTLLLTQDSEVGKKGEKLIIAKERISSLEKFFPNYKIIETKLGKEWENTPYIPLWDWQTKQVRNVKQHIVVSDTYVSTEDGTGIVHLAPYGEDDLRILRKLSIQYFLAVNEDGIVEDFVPEFQKRYFKEVNEKGDCLLDIEILKNLLQKGLLLAKEKVDHEYPFCYRCDTPLMYFPRKGWFLRMSDLRERLLQANELIRWQPPHIKEGRFGNWLENVNDWNFTRERYWGSPLPIWSNKRVGDDEKFLCIGSFEELKRYSTTVLEDDFDLHKPGIDLVELKNPYTGELYYRENFVLDSWFDAGIMPWGQWGYPYFEGSIEKIDGVDKQYPADFICEAIDQTRGWFYTLLACSVIYHTSVEAENKTYPNKKKPLPFPSSFKNVICTELVLDEKGQKMSKSKGNVVDPLEQFEKWGADPVRWLFYSVNPWTVKRFSEDIIQEGIQQVLLPLWNAYVFFTTYAEADGWTLEKQSNDYSTLDAWILSRLTELIENVTNALENFDVARSAQAITFFLDELNNWYIRRSRRRFWKSENDIDQFAAFTTLHKVLVTVTKLMAPFAPHLSEEIYQGLTQSDPNQDITQSVHLAKWPETSDIGKRDLELERKQSLIRDIVTIGHNLRQSQNLRVRQPLLQMKVCHRTEDLNAIEEIEKNEHVICEELNLKRVTFHIHPNEVVTFQCKPNLKTLGPRFGNRLKEISIKIQNLNSEQIENALKTKSLQIEQETFSLDDLLISCNAENGWVARMEGDWIISIQTTLTEELLAEGFVRELVNRIQNARKISNFEVSDRIHIDLWFKDKSVSKLLNDPLIQYLKRETLAVSLDIHTNHNIQEYQEVSGYEVKWAVRKVESRRENV
ncbi:MAG: isoleucine--tRNA ligase [bacterium]|nr:isoleucine--tRNA ligase [bacterium]